MKTAAPSRLPTTNPSLASSKAGNLEPRESEKEFVYSSDPLQAEVEHRITKVFDVFDTQHLKIVDVREVGTMVRALGQYSHKLFFMIIIIIIIRPNPIRFTL